jgi:hypothetical protein
MRPSPLYNLKQGINRLRIKGGANPSSLYDLLNGWISVDGSVKAREGTIRAETLNANTAGLMASNGIFNVFSSTLQAVPAGYVDNVLLDPNDTTQTVEIIWFAKPFMGFPYVVAEFANGDVFHYWLQNSGKWAASTEYNTGSYILPLTTQTGLAYAPVRTSPVNPTWVAETQIVLNNIVEPTEYTGFQYKAVAVAGTTPRTGSTEPVWPTVAAATLQEFGDFDLSSTDAGTTQGTTASTAQPLSTTITDRYGDSATIASSGTTSTDLTLPTLASTAVTTWAKGTLYAPGAVVQPSSSQGAFLNAIPNGDFENGDDGNWVLSAGASYYTGSNPTPYQGTHSMQFTASHSDETATMSSYGTVTPGQSVTASAYLNPFNTGAALSMGINLRWYNSANTFLSATAGARQEGGGWRLSTVSGIAPATATRVRVQIDGGNSTSAHSGYADLVSWNLETPTTVSNFLYEAVQSVTGTSGTTEPVWPTIAGNTVVDNTVTWKAIGTSIITWEAIPIMQSGTVEPVWPTVLSTAVLDASTFADSNGVNVITSINWTASSRQITDSKCPNTNAVALNSSHVFAVDNDIVDFSAAVDPTDWSTANNAGYLPTGLNNYGDNPAAVLALYRSNLVVFNSGGYQLWQTDPDPANMAFLDAQPVGSTFTRAAQSVANDLLFLTEVGVRNLATVGATANMQIGSSGQPIDPLILAQFKPEVAGPLPGDPYYADVGVLLALNGNTLDSSFNQLPTSATGVTFSNTIYAYGPVGGYFNGNSCIAVPIQAGGPIDLGGISTWTIEFWVTLGTPPAGNGTILFAFASADLSQEPMQFFAEYGGAPARWSLSGTVNSHAIVTALNIVPNVATFVTFVSTAGIVVAYSNGVGSTPVNCGAVGTMTPNFNLNVGAQGILGGIVTAGFIGGIQEFRVTKGVARYSANFPTPIPPSQPGSFAPWSSPFPGVVYYPVPISLYYPGRGQYWLFFGPQAFVLTVNGQGLRTWSRYVFPDEITDWTLNAGILYLRTEGDLVWQLDANTLVDDYGGSNTQFQGIIQTPYVDTGPIGYDKELIGVDIVGAGQVTIQVGWAQNDVTTFNDNPGFAASANVTPPFVVSAADTVPGEPIPIPMTAPSFTLILTFAGNQAWYWNASNLYVNDVKGTPTG